MVALRPEFVVHREASQRAVSFSVAEWERLREALEELEDSRAYDLVKARRKEVVPPRRSRTANGGRS